MERDLQRYPNDDNGDVLWQIASSGADLSYPREIDFAVVFTEEESALQFAFGVLRNYFKVQVSPYEESEVFPWQVYVHVVMQPAHAEITAFEQMLGEQAQLLGGRNDGWGFES